MNKLHTTCGNKTFGCQQLLEQSSTHQLLVLVDKRETRTTNVSYRQPFQQTVKCR